MTKITGGEPINPIFSEPVANDGYGLTIRQDFAARAMQGIISGMYGETQKKVSEYATYKEKSINTVVAEMSVEFADALIKELNKPTK